MDEIDTLRLDLTPPERETMEDVIKTTAGWSISTRCEGDIFVLVNIAEEEQARLIDELHRYAMHLSGNYDYDLAATAKSAAAKLEREVGLK